MDRGIDIGPGIINQPERLFRRDRSYPENVGVESFGLHRNDQRGARRPASLSGDCAHERVGQPTFTRFVIVPTERLCSLRVRLPPGCVTGFVQ